MSADAAQSNSKYLSILQFPSQVFYVSTVGLLQSVFVNSVVQKVPPWSGQFSAEDLSQCRGLAPIEMVTAGRFF